MVPALSPWYFSGHTEADSIVIGTRITAATMGHMDTTIDRIGPTARAAIGTETVTFARILITGTTTGKR